ncbi:hypothetical protein [Phaeodactylibacter xiamenensis]|uniref:hypothetical protein n=1 Tax=Phaeodactylibacter xiamenensis TaxID=1524460 RepID=UPI0024A92CA8|nr:hypothetical protein [Phaeodactylibacter xiamenensis]
MKNKIAIVHFSPLELYPPAINLLEYFYQFENELNIKVFSTVPNNNLKRLHNSKIEIIRYPPIIASDNILVKLWGYLVFYLSVFFSLIRFKPDKIIYFETLSALPCIWYKILRKRVNIFVHYHELVTLEELKYGRTLNKFINNIESKHYRSYKWISQTNQIRLNIFTDQYNLSEKLKSLNVMPNYPPQAWLNQDHQRRRDNNETIKLIHIGSLSLQGMYLQEVLSHFGSKPQYSIDFYSHNFSKEVREAIQLHNNCTIHGAIDYQDIPKLKGLYEVGLVMYKALSLNVKYCAPNKIFEYLALDLDVWCSDKLITAKNYERLGYYPKLIMVDYEDLANFDVEKAIDKTGLPFVPSSYACEPVYEKLIHEIRKVSDQGE